MELSTIIITKNQAWNIARLIESLLARTDCVSSKEIILVDSASTDETVSIASQYPIRVLRLRPEQTLSPAIGRYLGYKNSTGELVLFLDGDMELCSGWLEKALTILQDKPKAAVVAGKLIDLAKTANTENEHSVQGTDSSLADEVAKIGGAGLYRRSVFQEVGTFNPYLHSDEEPDLSIRIRHAGYRIFRLHHPIAYHFSDPPGELSTKVARWRRNLYLGAGQNLRYHIGDEIFWPYVKERGYGFIPGLGVLVGIFALAASVVFNQTIWFSLWLVFVGLIVFVDAIRKRSLYKTLVSLLERFFIADGTIRGFFKKPLNPDDYAVQFDVIK